jgi:hypothetical protein
MRDCWDFEAPRQDSNLRCLRTRSAVTVTAVGDRPRG